MSDSNEIVKLSDPLAESVGNLVVVTFPKSTSKNYPLAVHIAKGAHIYRGDLVDGVLINYAVFSKNREQACRTQGLLDYISEWKGIQVFIDGRLEKDIIQINRVLICYLKASACEDWQAHCFKVIDDPFGEEITNNEMSLIIRITDKPAAPKRAVDIDQYIFPCALIYRKKLLQANHPSSIEDQIQAVAVQNGCSWCPYFDSSNFRKSGVRHIQKDFFT